MKDAASRGDFDPPVLNEDEEVSEILGAGVAHGCHRLWPASGRKGNHLEDKPSKITLLQMRCRHLWLAVNHLPALDPVDDDCGDVSCCCCWWCC